MYTAFCDILAGGAYRGTMVLFSGETKAGAELAALRWSSFPWMRIIRAYYENEYNDAEFVAYVRKVA